MSTNPAPRNAYDVNEYAQALKEFDDEANRLNNDNALSNSGGLPETSSAEPSTIYSGFSSTDLSKFLSFLFCFFFFLFHIYQTCPAQLLSSSKCLSTMSNNVKQCLPSSTIPLQVFITSLDESSLPPPFIVLHDCERKGRDEDLHWRDRHLALMALLYGFPLGLGLMAQVSHLTQRI